MIPIIIKDLRYLAQKCKRAAGDCSDDELSEILTRDRGRFSLNGISFRRVQSVAFREHWPPVASKIEQWFLRFRRADALRVDPVWKVARPRLSEPIPKLGHTLPASPAGLLAVLPHQALASVPRTPEPAEK